jgi:hypothetical protein
MLWPEAMAGVVRPSACSNHPALGLRQRCPSLSQEGSFLHTLMTPRIAASATGLVTARHLSLTTRHCS